MSTTPNEQQIRDGLIGINGQPVHFDTNYFVEAGAGAGKTYILSKRIAQQLIRGNCTPNQIVAITFTNKATQELQERLDTEVQAAVATALQSETDPEQRKRLTALPDQLGTMQISTIHSFCRVMLQTMPFETALGIGWHFIEDDKAAQHAFLQQAGLQQPHRFDALAPLGISATYLENLFDTLCTHGYATMMYAKKSSAAFQSVRSGLISAGNDIADRYKGQFQAVAAHPDGALLHDYVQQLFARPTMDDEDHILISLLAGTMDKRNLLLNYRANGVWPFQEQLNNRVLGSDPNYEADHPLFVLIKQLQAEPGKKPHTKATTPREKAENQAFVAYKKDWLSMQYQGKLYLHTLAMETLLPLLEEYKQYKLDNQLADNNDLLYYADQMLRNPVAQDYFFNRYRTLYVDEFQDTDAIQTSILFRITDVVDDPATPRANWTDCKPRSGSLFLVGDPKQAIYRFRGADISIYDQVKQEFGAPNCKCIQLQWNYRSTTKICTFSDRVFDPAATVPSDEAFLLYNNPPYQTSYLKMQAKKAKDPAQTCVLSYGLIEPDPAIDTDVDKKEFLLAQDARRVAGLIKTMLNKKKTDLATPYVPSDFLVLTPGKSQVSLYSQALYDLGIPCIINGAEYLKEKKVIACGLAHLQALAHFPNSLFLLPLLTNHYNVSMSAIQRFKSKTSDNFPRGLFQTALLATVEQDTDDPELMHLCGVGRRLAPLFAAVDSQPPMSIIEQLFDGDFVLWDGLTAQEIETDYAFVQQLLNGLRLGATGSLLDYLDFALNYGETPIEHQLLLEAQPNAVRVMNHHKSKGLEGRVVILTYWVAKAISASFHLTTKNQLYAPVLIDNGPGRNASTRGLSPSWDIYPKDKTAMDYKAEEAAYLKAERARLRYVAATRAKETLVVCASKDWSALVDKADTTVPAVLKAAYENLIHKGHIRQNSTVTAICNPLPTATTVVPLPSWPDATAATLATTRFPITPSKLNHGEAHPKPADTAPVTAPTTPTVFAPFGSDWGNIVHRVMELAVAQKDYTQGGITAFARQAIYECLPQSLLTSQIYPLFGTDDDTSTDLTQGRIQWLADKTTALLSFLQNRDAPLVQLLSKGTAFPEMSFYTATKTGELHTHLMDNLVTADQGLAAGKALDVQGIIDLAILTQEGWVVVDYKTDRIRSTEDRDAYVQRLTQEYTNQISAYGKLLTQMTGKGMVGHFLCAIPLNGDLIPLDGTAAPAPQVVPDAPLAMTALYNRGHYNPVLATVNGAKAFALYCDNVPIHLVDKEGNPTLVQGKCRDFARGATIWLNATYPSANIAVDFTNAGSQVIIKRLLKAMKQGLSAEQWARFSLIW